MTLLSPTVVMLAALHTLALAVQKLSLSAAVWAPLKSGLLGISSGDVQLFTNIASLKSFAIRTDCRSPNLRLIVVVMLQFPRCSLLTGVRMSMSTWQRIHQKCAGSTGDGRSGLKSQDANRMARSTSAITNVNICLVLFERKRRHVILKSGGWWCC